VKAGENHIITGLHNFNSSLIIIRITKSRMRWTGHIPCMDEIRNAYSILVRKRKQKIHLGGLMWLMITTNSGLL
jgi:hypothetical protein